jgi:hypothetical protein
VNGSAGQVDASGCRTSVTSSSLLTGVVVGIPEGVSMWNTGLAGLPSKWPTNVVVPPAFRSCHDTYGVLREKTMSGRVESRPECEIGWPLLSSA